jgi:hypothetical protein
MFETRDQTHDQPNPQVPEVAPPSVAGFGTTPVRAWEVQKEKIDGKDRVTGVNEGKARAEYFQTARMANDPAMAAANDVPADQPIMSQPGAIPALLEAQKNAREGGKHKEYQAKRVKFEHEVGLMAAEESERPRHHEGDVREGQGLDRCTWAAGRKPTPRSRRTRPPDTAARSAWPPTARVCRRRRPRSGRKPTPR